MSRHDGVSCDSCLKSNFRGKRYKCLICYDYDLCATCFEAGATTTRHTTDHPVQCIITRSDFDIFYGGEAVTAEQPQSFVCPYCSKMGFTEVLLQEHVTTEHVDSSSEVVCPICASLPGGDPNHVTDDFAAHLTLEHRGPREFEEPTGIRHVRRIPHAGRGVSGARTRRATNMHFSSGGGSSLTGLSPNGRESMDPIADLLSQLSSVRSRAAAAQSVSTQLQQLEMQLQSTRQQLERLPRRQAMAASEAAQPSAPSNITSQGTTTATTNNNSSSNSLYLLPRCTDSVIDESSHELQQERMKRSLFVQELLLSTLTEHLQISDSALENSTVLEKLPSSSIEESEKGKSDSSLDGKKGGDDKENVAGGVKKDSVDTSCNGATESSKSIGRKSIEKVGTKQKGGSAVATSSVGSQNGRGGAGNQTSRSAGRQSSLQFQSQGDRHSQQHSMRPSAVMQNNVDLANNFSLNVAIGGGADYDTDNPQPLPGRPGSAGRDRDGRLNPASAKRNMVKHLPATKTSDREPPPH